MIIVGQNVAAQSQNELIGQKIADDANFALDNIAYHLSTRMNNNYQVTGLAFMFNITLERVQSNYSIEYYQDVVDEDHLIAVDNDYILPMWEIPLRSAGGHQQISPGGSRL